MNTERQNPQNVDVMVGRVTNEKDLVGYLKNAGGGAGDLPIEVAGDVDSITFESNAEQLDTKMVIANNDESMFGVGLMGLNGRVMAAAQSGQSLSFGVGGTDLEDHPQFVGVVSVGPEIGINRDFGYVDENDADQHVEDVILFNHTAGGLTVTAQTNGPDYQGSHAYDLEDISYALSTAQGAMSQAGEAMSLAGSTYGELQQVSATASEANGLAHTNAQSITSIQNTMPGITYGDYTIDESYYLNQFTANIYKIGRICFLRAVISIKTRINVATSPSSNAINFIPSSLSDLRPVTYSSNDIIYASNGTIYGYIRVDSAGRFNIINTVEIPVNTSIPVNIFWECAQ